MEEFDLLVIGGGPAGYTGAIRASQLGMKVACVDKRSTLGGTCLNVGCIPSKALLNFSEKYENAKHHFPKIGINVSPSLDFEKMMEQKTKIVSDLCNGIDGLFIKNKIKKITGTASFISQNIVEITNDKQEIIKISAKKILIATGSDVIKLPSIEINEKNIISSTGALSLQKVPNELIVVGGGYIGLELGSVYNRLGSKVTVIEYSNTIVPALDEEVRNQFKKILEKQGLDIKCSTKVISATENNNKVFLKVEDLASNQVGEISCDVLLMSVGRKANTNNLGLENIGISTDNLGRIDVNESFQTNVSNIYAVGDVIKGPMLAHKAEEEAVAAVEIIATGVGHVNYNIIPSVVYTSPEVASIGATEQELKDKGISYKIGKFPFLANSRARTICTTDGFVKIIADSITDRILGAHIIGHEAGTLIAEITAVMEFGGSAEDIARTCHAHPTLSEAIKEAALNVDKRAINF